MNTRLFSKVQSYVWTWWWGPFKLQAAVSRCLRYIYVVWEIQEGHEGAGKRAWTLSRSVPYMPVFLCFPLTRPSNCISLENALQQKMSVHHHWNCICLRSICDRPSDSHITWCKERGILHFHYTWVPNLYAHWWAHLWEQSNVGFFWHVRVQTKRLTTMWMQFVRYQLENIFWVFICFVISWAPCRIVSFSWGEVRQKSLPILAQEDPGDSKISNALPVTDSRDSNLQGWKDLKGRQTTGRRKSRSRLQRLTSW